MNNNTYNNILSDIKKIINENKYLKNKCKDLQDKKDDEIISTLKNNVEIHDDIHCYIMNIGLCQKQINNISKKIMKLNDKVIFISYTLDNNHIYLFYKNIDQERIRRVEHAFKDNIIKLICIKII